ncbi:MAG: hypothetical protein Q9214_000586 [Letrouitia sp. 1 TL-2023]
MGSSVNVTEKFTPTSQGPHPEVVPESGGLELDRSSHAPEHRGDGAWQEENTLYKPYPQNHSVRRTVLGLKPLTFWLLVLLLTVLLATGIGVGLGIGLPRSHKTANPPPPASTTSVTLPSTSSTTNRVNVPAPTASPQNVSPSSNRDISCPANNSLSYTPASNSPKSTAFTVNTTTLTYDIQCNTTYTDSDDITDLQYIPNTNLSACIDLCSVYSVQVPHGGGENNFYDLCSGVTVTPDGVCQLKSGVEEGAAGIDKTARGESAMLIW